MSTVRFQQLARSLAARDRDLPDALASVRPCVERLRAHAHGVVEAFADAARSVGAVHLTDVTVGPVITDAKHVDCLSFAVVRGRWEALCVAKPCGTARLVGPFRRGKAEGPCADYALADDAARAPLEEMLLALLTEASRR